MGARPHRSREDGFTLMELAVVMIIIAILATIAIAVFLGQREKAERSSAISSVRNTSTLAEAIRLDDPDYEGDASVYEEEAGGGFDFDDDGPSTGPTVVSIATYDGDGDPADAGPTIVLAARGGGRCYWARLTTDGEPSRGHQELGSEDECTAADPDLEDADGQGW